MGFFENAIRAVSPLAGNMMDNQRAGKDALNEQRSGAAQATSALTGSRRRQMGMLSPYRAAGKEALGDLQGLGDMGAEELIKDPSYQFRLSEGLKGVNMGAAARGSLNSGATMKALTRYGQDYASTEYDKAYGREFGRLSQLAGLGSQANLAAVGAEGQYGQNIANVHTGMANAAAAQRIAGQNSQNALFGNIIKGVGLFA